MSMSMMVNAESHKGVSLKLDEHARRDLKGNNWGKWTSDPTKSHADRVKQVEFWVDAILDDDPDDFEPEDIFTIKVLERWLAVFS